MVSNNNFSLRNLANNKPTLFVPSVVRALQDDSANLVIILFLILLKLKQMLQYKN